MDKDRKKYYQIFENSLLKIFQVVSKHSDENVQSKVTKAKNKYRDTDKNSYIDYTLSKLRPHAKLIIENDPFLFSLEYSNSAMRLISGLDFKLFWSNLEEKQQDQIWSLLKNLYMAGSYALGVGTKDPVVKNIINILEDENNITDEVNRDLKKEAEKDKLKEEKRLKKAGEAGDGGSGSMLSGLSGLGGGLGGGLGENLITNMVEKFGGLNDLESLFDDDNLLVKLTKEVGDEMMKSEDFKKLGIDPNKKMDNPEEIMNLLFGKDSNKLQNLAECFGDKLQKKMEEKKLTEEEICQATNDIGNKVVNKFANTIPGFEELKNLSQMKPEDMSNDDRQKLQAEVCNKLMSGLTQNMTQTEKENFLELNKTIISDMEDYGTGMTGLDANINNAGEIGCHLPDPNINHHIANIMETAWEEAKIKHLESLGGIEIENPEEDLDKNLFKDLCSKSPIVEYEDYQYIVCGNAIMKVSNEEWHKFNQECENHSDEISKFLDHEYFFRKKV